MTHDSKHAMQDVTLKISVFTKLAKSKTVTFQTELKFTQINIYSNNTEATFSSIPVLMEFLYIAFVKQNKYR